MQQQQHWPRLMLYLPGSFCTFYTFFTPPILRSFLIRLYSYLLPLALHLYPSLPLQHLLSLDSLAAHALPILYSSLLTSHALACCCISCDHLISEATQRCTPSAEKHSASTGDKHPTTTAPPGSYLHGYCHHSGPHLPLLHSQS